MKTFKLISIGAGALFVVIAIITIFFKNELTDMLNPFIPKEDVYVLINRAGEKDDDLFVYTLNGINADGKDTEVTFTASKELRDGAYLKLVAKRTYIKSWEEVNFEEIPIKAQKILSNT